MFKKCKANCQANDNLYLRNNVFYYMKELPRQNGKRRYFIKSLHTKNYYEALEKVKIMKNYSVENYVDIESLILATEQLAQTMAFDEYEEEIDCGGQTMVRKQRYISPQNDPKKIHALIETYLKIKERKPYISNKVILQRMCRLENMMEKVLLELHQQNKTQTHGGGKPTEKHTVEEIVDAWIIRENNGNAEQTKKRSFFKHMTKKLGLTMQSDYADFNSEDKINDIIQEIQTNKKWSTDATKAKKIGYLKSLYNFANREYPDLYRDFTNRYPTYKKGISKNPHMPYSDQNLKEIFNPKHDHFKKNPDDFWVILMGLFTGARTNAATTLKYKDIVNVDDYPCIHFNNDDDKIKHLKTEATVRLLPIPQQLQDLGFVDWVQRKKKRLNANDNDTIFTKAVTRNRNYDNKYVYRQILAFIRGLKLSNPYKGKLDFHSFRNNASLQLQNAHVPASFINDIIGWSGSSTMEKHYSKHNLKQIKEQADKLRYDFLQLEFDYWKKIMSEK